MNKIISNAMRSWITSGIGAALGLPQMWMGLEGLFDADPVTGFEWKIFVTGALVFIGFLVARDGNKSSEDVKVKVLPAPVTAVKPKK